MRAWRWLVAAVVAALLAGCASLPPLEGRAASTAITDTADTRLGRSISSAAADHPGLTGTYALTDAREAFAARVRLAAAAEKSIDAQYYIWHDDDAGMLMFEALWRAAERGVRVRLLLDDVNTKGLDRVLATLDAHPNIEVRLYNPLVQRSVRLLNFIGDFERVNRRMHNKSFTADSQASVVGGRNVGDEYFGAAPDVTFSDLDVLAVGAAVREVSAQFDRYWNCASAYPAFAFVGTVGTEAATELDARFAALHASPGATDYLDAVDRTALVQKLITRTLDLQWARAHVIYDDPAKTLDTTARTDVLLFPELVRTIGRPERSLDLVSPYLIPGEQGAAAIAAVAQRGVRVRILTNSLSSSEASVVHAGYAKRREGLLRAGVRIFEMKAVAGAPKAEEKQLGPSVGSALHAKTYAVDRARIFVGSFNFDPRSARLNTEMGIVLEDAALAGRLADAFETVIPLHAYEVRFAADGQSLEWIERTLQGETLYATEPETSWFRRAGSGFMELLPIDWLL